MGFGGVLEVLLWYVAMFLGGDNKGKMSEKKKKKLLEKIVVEQLKIVGFHLPNGGIGNAEKIGEGYNFVNS